MAAVDPWIHVCAGGSVFHGGGEAREGLPKAATCAPGNYGGRGDHGVGAAVRDHSEPELWGLGLPGHAPELSGTDLPALFRCMDAAGSLCYVAVWQGGEEAKMIPWLSLWERQESTASDVSGAVLHLFTAWFGIVCPPQNVICGGFVKISKGNNITGGDFPFPGFVVAIYPLVDIQIGCNLFLHQIVIFSQIF